MKYKAAIFDMDGTILDTLKDLSDALNHSLKANSMPTRTIEEARGFVGNGILKLVERGAMPESSETQIQKVYEEFLDYYKEHCKDSTKVYDGIIPLLKELKEAGCLVAVVSNKRDFAVKELCNEYFPGIFQSAMGEKDGVRKKPAPDSVLATMEQLKVTPQETVYIGDSDVDIETAMNAGTDHIIVTWGFRNEDFLRKKGGIVFAQKPEDIKKIILG